METALDFVPSTGRLRPLAWSFDGLWDEGDEIGW
jgi:hypothetical protein